MEVDDRNPIRGDLLLLLRKIHFQWLRVILIRRKGTFPPTFIHNNSNHSNHPIWEVRTVPIHMGCRWYRNNLLLHRHMAATHTVVAHQQEHIR